MPKMCTIFGMYIKCLTAIANKYLQANNLADRFNPLVPENFFLDFLTETS